MSSILEHINKNPQETQRLIGLEYDELQRLIQNAEKLHQEKQALLESQKIRIISGGGGLKILKIAYTWIGFKLKKSMRI